LCDLSLARTPGQLPRDLSGELLTADSGYDEDETSDDFGDLLPDDDDSAGTPLRAFAAAPSTPAALAARALAWHEHIHYGLWRIDDPVPGPGLHLPHGHAERAGTASATNCADGPGHSHAHKACQRVNRGNGPFPLTTDGDLLRDVPDPVAWGSGVYQGSS